MRNDVTGEFPSQICEDLVMILKANLDYVQFIHVRMKILEHIKLLH